MIYVAPGNDYAGGKQNITPEHVLHSDFYHAPKVKINIEKRQKQSKYSKYPDGRAIALTEVISQLLGYSQVYTNIDFEMISTTVMAERPGYDQITPGTSDIMVMSSRGPADLIPANHITSVAVHNSLPLLPWQKLT
jgi:hypothetical protein